MLNIGKYIPFTNLIDKDFCKEPLLGHDGKKKKQYEIKKPSSTNGATIIMMSKLIVGSFLKIGFQSEVKSSSYLYSNKATIRFNFGYMHLLNPLQIIIYGHSFEMRGTPLVTATRQRKK